VDEDEASSLYLRAAAALLILAICSVHAPLVSQLLETEPTYSLTLLMVLSILAVFFLFSSS